MAARPKGYGLTAEVKGKIDAKYDPAVEKETMEWIASYVADFDPPSGSENVQTALKDGVVLCKLMGELSGTPIKFNTSKMAFKQMENIGKFLEAADKYGVAKSDTFQTVDLYEGGNMVAVINGIHSLGRKAQSKGQRGIGPKESAKNERTFTEEQLRSGDGVIGLQMGSNKGASQAGQNFGKTRAIID